MSPSEVPQITPQTIAQKLVAKAAGKSHVIPGEIVTCKVDLAMFHDSSGPRRLAPMLERLGATVWDRSKIVLITDHYVPTYDDESRKILQITRDWAKANQIRNFYDGEGICHVVLPQKGHLKPGLFAVGGDSHSPTGGAFGAYMFGVGATEMLGVVVTGEIWLRVPETILMQWDGQLGAGVTAKDMMLFLCGKFGMDGGRYQAVEFAGSAIRALSMQERMTMANMTAELGGQVGLIAPDETTQHYLATAGAVDVDVAAWQGLFVPKGTPEAVVKRLTAEMQKAIALPEVKAKLEDFGLEVAPSDGPALGRFVQQETQFWHALIRERKHTHALLSSVGMLAGCVALAALGLSVGKSI